MAAEGAESARGPDSDATEARPRGRGRHRIHAVTSSMEPDLTVRRVGREQAIKHFEKPRGRFSLAADLTEAGNLPITDAVERVFADWQRQVSDGLVSQGVAGSYSSLMRSFASYLGRRGITELWDVTPTLVLEWLHTPTEKGTPAADSTRIGRRTVARTFFNTAQKLGLTDLNPAASVHEQQRSERHVHAFSKAEIDRLKRFAQYRIGESKTPTMLALLLLGATSREVAYIRAGDIDVANNRLCLHDGAARNRARWVPMDDAWARSTLLRYVETLQASKPGLDSGEAARHLLAYRPQTANPNGLKRAASVATTMDKFLRMADVYEPGQTRIESIREYLALRVFTETRRLEDVAVRLGLSSLDTIAHIVGSDWVNEYGIAADPPAVEGEGW
jgi:site-specific recombinase XerD